MPHSLTSDMEAVTLSAVCAPVLFVEIQTVATPVRFWTGYGNFLWNSQTWTGAGSLLGIGAITEQNVVQATGAGLTLSGVDNALVAIALANLQRYLPAKVWLGALDDMFQIVTDPYLILNGRVDTSKITATGKTSTILVNAESRLIAMRNPKWRRYTDIDQRIEHPGDAGFMMVDTLQDATINFHG